MKIRVPYRVMQDVLDCQLSFIALRIFSLRRESCDVFRYRCINVRKYRIIRVPQYENSGQGLLCIRQRPPCEKAAHAKGEQIVTAKRGNLIRAEVCVVAEHPRGDDERERRHAYTHCF